jgi:chromosome partitioning protein
VTAPIVAFAQQKGGAGKTTLAVHLAAWLTESGRTWALVDADPQQAATFWAREAFPDAPVLSPEGEDGEAIGRALEAAQDLEVSLVIADGPAGSSAPTRRLLVSADLAVIPCGPSALDLRAMRQTLDLVARAQEIRGGELPRALVVLCRQQPHTLVSRDVIDSAPEIAAPAPVARSVIRHRSVIADAAGQGTTAFALGSRGRDAAEEIRGVCEEIAALLPA